MHGTVKATAQYTIQYVYYIFSSGTNVTPNIIYHYPSQLLNMNQEDKQYYLLSRALCQDVYISGTTS